MEQEAIVVRIEGDQAYVELVGTGQGCGHCHEEGGCQSGILSQIFRQAPRQFRIHNAIGAVTGERVVVLVADGATLRAALLAYLVPALLLIVGALAGTILGGTANSDAGTLLGALFGLALAGIAGYTVRRGASGQAILPALVRKNSSVCFKEICR